MVKVVIATLAATVVSLSGGLALAANNKNTAANGPSFPGYSKESCKNGGWQTNFPAGTFKNQGDCVSFFATGGKNPPAGS